ASENEATARLSMEQGQFLISQLSEYSAIFLCHQLRHLDIDLLMGLSDEIYPPKAPHKNPRGITTYQSLFLNRHETKAISEIQFEPSDVIMSTLSSVEGKKVQRHLGIISEQLIISAKTFHQNPRLNLTHTQE